MATVNRGARRSARLGGPAGNQILTCASAVVLMLLLMAEGITIHHAPGHTPGHQVVRVRSQGRRAIVSADAFNHPAQFSHPDWPSGADAIHPQAALTRRALIAELLSNPGTTIAPTHFAEPFGRMKTGPDGLAGWIPL